MVPLAKSEIQNNKKVETIQILKKMIKYNLPDIFIFDAFHYSIQFEGIYELLQMWNEESDSQEKNEIISDIQDLIDSCQVTENKLASYDLIQMWNEESDYQAKNEILSDIQHLMDDCQITKNKIISIGFNDLEKITEHIREFKHSLLVMIDEKGGIKALSEKTGIPQQSLLRFFNSNSISQRTTLLKIKNFLNIEKIDIENKIEI